jgi:hypothetical protein
MLRRDNYNTRVHDLAFYIKSTSIVRYLMTTLNILAQIVVGGIIELLVTALVRHPKKVGQ